MHTISKLVVEFTAQLQQSVDDAGSCGCMKVVKRVPGHPRRREDRAIQVELTCAGCEPLLSAELQAIRNELQADKDQQLRELRKRVCTNHSFLLSCN